MTYKTSLSIELLDQKNLTKTEIKVLLLKCKGLIKKQIADRLGCAYKTIDTHDANIKRKLNAHTSTEVVALAVAEGLVKISKSNKIGCIFFAVLIPVLSLINTDDARAGQGRLRMPRPIATRVKCD